MAAYSLGEWRAYPVSNKDSGSPVLSINREKRNMELLEYLKQYMEYIQNQLGLLTSQKGAISMEQARAVSDDLSNIMRIEREKLFAPLMQFAGSREVISDLQEDLNIMQKYLERLQGAQPVYAHDSLAHLLDIFIDHLDDMEERLFPLIEKVLSPEQIEQLTEQMRGKMRELTEHRSS